MLLRGMEWQEIITHLRDKEEERALSCLQLQLGTKQHFHFSDILIGKILFSKKVFKMSKRKASNKPFVSFE